MVSFLIARRQSFGLTLHAFCVCVFDCPHNRRRSRQSMKTVVAPSRCVPRPNSNSRISGTRPSYYSFPGSAHAKRSMLTFIVEGTKRSVLKYTVEGVGCCGFMLLVGASSARLHVLAATHYPENEAKLSNPNPCPLCLSLCLTGEGAEPCPHLHR